MMVNCEGVKRSIYLFYGFVQVSGFSKKVYVHRVKDLSVFPPCTSVFRGL